ncbi:MAG TPA: hypothetical protein VFG69_02390, partial [Nannocystaceae bacterium]|nr:hypothetical protein [Nannocystaceae bacterium]
MSKPGAPKVDGASESSAPIAEPDPWLLDEIDELAGKAEKDGATPPDGRKSEPAAPATGASESSGAGKPATDSFATRTPAGASEASGASKPASANKPASESSGARKAEAGLPPKPAEPGKPKVSR